MRTFTSIVEAIKSVKRLHSDAKVAEALDIKVKSLATMKVRNTIPLDKLDAFCAREGLNLGWLLSGQGTINVGSPFPSERDALPPLKIPPAPAQPMVAEPAAEFTITVDVRREISEHNRQLIEKALARMIRIIDEGDYRKTGSLFSMLEIYDPGEGKK